MNPFQVFRRRNHRRSQPRTVRNLGIRNRLCHLCFALHVNEFDFRKSLAKTINVLFGNPPCFDME